jgi:alkylation response protein AidB-like acyl-CoA dehydrogenase
LSEATANQFQAGTPLSAADILENARALTPWLRERREQIEATRRLPEEVVARLRAAGMFRLAMPRSWGGPELSSMRQVEVIEELSRGDASSGWCVMIGCDSGLYSGYLDDAVAREMYPRLDMVQAGWVYPIGRAERVADGYRVSGDWMFGSGVTHCDWLAAGCLVFEDGEPLLEPNGLPRWRIMIASPDAYEVQDTWHVTGLRGSGSNDYRCRDLFVPEEHSFSLFEPAQREGLLWRRGDTLLRKMSGVPLGIARDAIDTVTEILRDKVDRLSGVPYRDVPRVQTVVAEAESLYGAARAYVFDALERLWVCLERGDEPDASVRAHVWLSRTTAFQNARRAVQDLYDAVGGSAIYVRKSPLDRQLRDIQTICQHIAAQKKGWEPVGQLLLGGSSGIPSLL